MIKGKYIEKAIKLLKNRRIRINLISLVLNHKYLKFSKDDLEKKKI